MHILFICFATFLGHLATDSAAPSLRLRHVEDTMGKFLRSMSTHLSSENDATNRSVITRRSFLHKAVIAGSMASATLLASTTAKASDQDPSQIQSCSGYVTTYSYCNTRVQNTCQGSGGPLPRYTCQVVVNASGCVCSVFSCYRNGCCIPGNICPQSLYGFCDFGSYPYC